MPIAWTPPPAYEHVPPRVVFAHRGASAERPENTIVAFDRARELGAALELDVRGTADGAVVVLHDADVDRTTDGHGSVRGHTAAQLAALDAGHGFRDAAGGRPWAGRDVRVPHLDDVLARYPDTPINIDVKQVQPSIVGAVVTVVRAAHARRTAGGQGGPLPVLLTSFDGGVMAELEAARPPCGLGLSRPEVLAILWHSYTTLPLRWLGIATALPARLCGRALQMPRRFAGLPTFSAAVRAALVGARVPVHLWTVDDPDEARRLFAGGVAGVVSNDPAALLEGTTKRPAAALGLRPSGSAPAG